MPSRHCLPLDTATDGDLQSIDASSAALTSAIYNHSFLGILAIAQSDANNDF